MSTKVISRNALLYTVDFNWGDILFAPSNTTTNMVAVLNSVFPLNKDLKFKYKNKDAITIALNVTDTYLFGSCGILEFSVKDTLVRARDINTLSIEDVEWILEKYTYFLWNFTNGRLASIQNDNLPSFKNLFKESLTNVFSQHEYFPNISLVPETIPNLEVFLKDIENNISSLSFSSNNPETIDALTPMDVLGDKELVSKISVKMDIINDKPKNGIGQRIINILKPNSLTAKISYQTENPEIENTIDLFEETLTKKISIIIPHGFDKLEKEIEKQLKEVISHPQN